MKNALLTAVSLLLFLFYGCKKEAVPQNLSTPIFTSFIIPKGEHAATGNVWKEVDIAALNFIVRFDSSAIYQTVDPANQHDINKLYGFADNSEHHHQYSARYGWRWSDGALRLFAYTYNNGVRQAKELTIVSIGKEINCSIKVLGNAYEFTTDGETVTMPRLSKTATAKGYQLYPYFGGDETAPHDIAVFIKTE